jgi:hypothetical protein
MSLPFGAGATVGGVINIGNGESIRFELSGSIRTEEELAGLLAGFDRTLERLGRGDELTRTAVDSFRARVFGENGKKAEPKIPSNSRELATEKERLNRQLDAKVAAHTEQMAKVAPAPVAKAEDAPDFACEDCGNQLTEAELRTCNLFYTDGTKVCKGCRKKRDGG